MIADVRSRATPEEVAQVLDDAADYILINGWTQGGCGLGFNGERCSQQAINLASKELDLGYGILASEAFCDYLGLSYTAKPPHTAGERIVAWNDAKNRTEDEVIDALRHTAKGIRNGEIPLNTKEQA